MHDYLEERRAKSDELFAGYQRQIAGMPSLRGLEDLCIYATGSYGRGEASEKSDLDLFFVAREGKHITRERQTWVFSDLIAIGRDAEPPWQFSRDCEFLEVHPLRNLLDHLGRPLDDYGNTFTARMLLLLEGRAVVGHDIYNDLIERILHRYYEDYLWHAKDFVPRFLLNDITRFWKTLCLNYEAYRSRESLAQGRLDNLKLRYARKLTCFATVAAILPKVPGITASEVLELTKHTPIERLELYVRTREGNTIPEVEKVQAAYAGFLQLATDASNDDAILVDEERWNRAKRDSNEFGEALVSLIRQTNENALQLVAL